MNTGIYFIVNIITNMLYIGSSVDLEERFKTHKKQLNGGVHINSYLQYAWDKYGENNENYRLNNKERIAAKMSEYYYKRKAAR